jgi:hypothetical protein
MGIVNRRNAVFGWAVWEAVKYAARQKARMAVPTVDTQTKRPNKSAVLVAVVTVAGLAMLVRKVTSSSNGHAPPEE